MLKVYNIEKGVQAVLRGFNKEELSIKIAQCQSGECSCSCTPEVMKKIQNIEVSSEHKATYITIIGDVRIEDLAPMMKECLL